MTDTLTLEELSQQTGEPVERLEEWRSAGAIGSAPGSGFALEDVEKVKLVELFLRRGVPLDAISRAVRKVIEVYPDLLSPTFGGSGPTYSLEEAAAILDMDLPVLLRFWQGTAIGVAERAVNEEELGLLRGLKLALDVGMPEDALMDITRVFADALSRIGEAEQRFFRAHIQTGFLARGAPTRQLAEEAQAVAERLRPITEPVIAYFHRMGQFKAMREDLIVDLAREMGLLKEPEVPGQVTRAVAFVDLSSFTPLASNMGDEKAAEVLERFSRLVRDAGLRWEGRVVKQIGDAFMLVFPDPGSAVSCLMEIKEHSVRESQFPAVRGGIHWGTALYREGDYVGSVVNIASRIAGEGDRNQVLVSGEVRKEAAGVTGLEFMRLGRRKLKGLAEPVEIFEVRRAGTAASEKTVDPVCGIELAPAEVAASLRFEEAERSFCSQECLRKFVVSPGLYGGGP